MSAAIPVAVIVVNHETAEALPACLEAYDAQDHPALEVIVVDNASRDGSRRVLDEVSAQLDHEVQIVHNTSNRGFAGGINDGLARTTAPVVVFSNVDVVPRPDLVRRAVGALLADDRRGTVQPRLLRQAPDADGRTVVDTTGHVLDRARLVGNRGEGEPDGPRHDTPGEVFGASGALVVHRRAMLDDVAWPMPAGPEILTEDLFAFFDDVELDWRARRMGWTAWYEPTAVATHERGGAGPRRTRRVEALNWANRLLVVVTCDDAGALVRAAPLVAAVTLLKTLELAVTAPRALPAAIGRLVRGLPAARRRRRILDARARVDARTVVDAWVVDFELRAWVRRWWWRVRGRSPGVARVAR
jgi:GT2 family glycosyltransferase